MFQNDFDYSVIDQVAHRPYPMRKVPWIMTQTWHDVLFLHWPVDGGMMRALLPPGLELDLFDGQAYAAVVPFYMTNMGPRGVPALPGFSSMPELNVRTYVTAKGIPGVYFFSLDASNPVVVGAARAMFHLPYHTADMAIHQQEDWIEYTSRRKKGGGRPAEFRGRYRSVGAGRQPERGSLESFLTERYCLYSLDDALHMYRVDVHHAPWNLTLAEAGLDVNTMADANGIRLPAISPLAHFAKRQDVVVWPLARVDK